MGTGYWLTENLIYDRQTGKLLTNNTFTYEVPGCLDIPIEFHVKFLQNVNNQGFLRSKAVGEPAICLSIVTMFALRYAIDAIRSDNGIKEKWYRLGNKHIFDFSIYRNQLRNFFSNVD